MTVIFKRRFTFAIDDVVKNVIKAVTDAVETVSTSTNNNTQNNTSSISSINDLPDIVYHGTISTYKDSLLSGINVKAGFKSADFGQGFYTTSNYGQAKKLAIDRAKAYNKRYPNRHPAQPMILYYRIDKLKLSHFKGLFFTSPDNKWKEFIYNNRVGIDFLVSKYYNKDGKYDYVYGYVADSNITDMVGYVQRQQITFGDFIDKLKVLKQFDYNQLSFHTDKVVSVLELQEIEIIEMEAILIE